MTHEEDLLHKRMKRLLKATPDGRVEFKNYTDLCKTLKTKVKTGGSSKKAHLSLLQKLCNLTKNETGFGLFFTEVYTKEKVNELLLQKYSPNNRPAYEINEAKGIYGIYVDDTLYYIGSSINLRDRLLTHCSEIYTNKEQKETKYIILKELIDNGGKLSFKVLDSEITEENRYEIEYKYIRELCPLLNGSGMGYLHIMHTSRKQLLIKEYTELITQNNKQIQNLQKENILLQQKLQVLNSLDDDATIEEIMQKIAS